jgi:molybdate transport system substrate-binding protein
MVVSTPTFAADPQPVVVFAGSASQPPLEAAAEAFQEKSGIPVILHMGGSGAMLSQVRLTGYGDLYIPGSPDYMEKAQTLGLVGNDVAILAYLVPALLVPEGNPLGITGLSDLKRPGLRVGLADPDGVCVGLYAVEILEANDLVSTVRPNLRGMVESCAKAASMIPLKLVDVVIGWREFASWNPEMIDAVLLEPKQVPRLAYVPAARLQNAANPQGADAFITFLTSGEGQAIFKKWGYLTAESAAREFAPQARIGGSYTLPRGW